MIAYSPVDFSLIWTRNARLLCHDLFCHLSCLILHKQDNAGSKAVQETVNQKASQLLDTYGNTILRFAYSYLHNMQDAEDIVQDTLIQFLRKQPKLENAAHEKAWLLRVAANLSKNRLQYNRIRQTDPLEETLAEEKQEDLSFVWDAVKHLPCPLREVIHLYYYEAFSTAEIAQILNRKESTVRSDLHRSRMKLKEILKEAYDFE